MNTVVLKMSEKELDVHIERKINELIGRSNTTQILNDWARINGFEPTKMTKTELLKLKRARVNYSKGNYVEWSQLKNELDRKRRSKS